MLKGFLATFLSAFLAVETYRLMKRWNIIIRLPSTMPPSVLEPFESLLPVIVVTILCYFINTGSQQLTMGQPFPVLLANILKPLVAIGDSFGAMCFVIFLWQFLWFCGIHGGAVVGAFMYPIFFSNLMENQQALATGQPIPHIVTKSFLNAFVWQGGAGATLGLAIALLFSKHKYLYLVGRLSLIPSLFNISEVLMFGLPIALNPIFFIPFMGIPLVNFAIAYYLTQLKLVSSIVALGVWTMPSPLLGFVTSNFSVSAMVLPIFLIFLSAVLYFPFIKLYEKDLVKKGYPDDVIHS